MKYESSKSLSDKIEAKVFWSEIAPYENRQPTESDDANLVELLENYISGAYKKGDCVVILITELHRARLYEQLLHSRVHLNEMLVNHQFIALDAEDTLERFMVDGHPNEEQFAAVIDKVIAKANKGGRPIRVFGELIAHLWAKGCTEATLELEHLWANYCQRESLSLMRAYPGNGMVENVTRPMMYVYGTWKKDATYGSYFSTQHDTGDFALQKAG